MNIRSQDRAEAGAKIKSWDIILPNGFQDWLNSLWQINYLLLSVSSNCVFSPLLAWCLHFSFCYPESYLCPVTYVISIELNWIPIHIAHTTFTLHIQQKSSILHTLSFAISSARLVFSFWPSSTASFTLSFI